jgi:renalase
VTVGIIGAGIAGLGAARVLQAGGARLQVFDKGRAPGGRVATRRMTLASGAEITFDHGAQYVSADAAGLVQHLQPEIDAGQIASWDVAFDAAVSDRRLVGVPGMSRIGRILAEPFGVALGTEIEALEGEARAWILRTRAGERLGPFRHVIIAVPPEQCARLLAPVAPDMTAIVRRVRSRPCWTVMLAYAARIAGLPDAMERPGHALEWIARNASKPGRAAIETIIVQAGADWSERHLEAGNEDVGAVIAAMFHASVLASEPIHVAAHRWRYARVEAPLGPAFLLDDRLGLATCGDWHLGRDVDAAWRSGSELGETLLPLLRTSPA